MKHLYIVFALVIATVAVRAQENPVQIGRGHRFACGDYSQGKVFIVNADGKVEWEYKAPHCNDVWVLPNGNVLFNTGRGVMEVTRDKKVVLNFQPKSEIYAVQRLANGNTFVGDCGRGKLIELDASGKVVKEISLLPPGKKGGHAFMRNARKLPNGNYLVAHYGPQCVKEYDPNGKVVMEIKAPGGPHSVARLPNGNTMIATGDHGRKQQLFEVDKAGKTVWKVTNDDFDGEPLKFMTGFHVLPNGNIVMSNWVGHHNFGKAPHIFEITRDKKVVWRFQDHKTMKTISSVQVLDVPGNPLKGEVVH